MNNFESEDKLFDFKNNTTVNNYLIFILKKLVKNHPEQWKGRKLYPHLFRHSRLTELARGKFNEAQIRKFAGWSADSTMAKIYFHLNDEDIKNIMTDSVVETPKPKPKEPKMCKICDTENRQENLFCWKCGNVLNEEDREKMGVEVIIQPYEVQELRQENKELKIELISGLADIRKQFDSQLKLMKEQFGIPPEAYKEAADAEIEKNL
jgi:hypothetical protein